MLGTKKEPSFQFPNIPPQGTFVDLSSQKPHRPLHVLLTPPYKIWFRTQIAKPLVLFLLYKKEEYM